MRQIFGNNVRLLKEIIILLQIFISDTAPLLVSHSEEMGHMGHRDTAVGGRGVHMGLEKLGKDKITALAIEESIQGRAGHP